MPSAMENSIPFTPKCQKVVFEHTKRGRFRPLVSKGGSNRIRNDDQWVSRHKPGTMHGDYYRHVQAISEL